MSSLRALKKLIFGETWTLPIGLAVVVTTAAWADLTGVELLIGVIAVLALSVERSARRRQ